MKRIKIPKIVEPSRTEYFERMAEGRELEVLDKPCHDCAVTCGLYMPYAEALVDESIELQDKVLSTWFCHNHTNKACRGAYNYVHSKRK